MLATRFDHLLGWLFQSPPLVIAFRGEMLTKVMLDHRISIRLPRESQGALAAQRVPDRVCDHRTERDDQHVLEEGSEGRAG